MKSDQLIGWLEGKLDELGLTKVIPHDETLNDAWRRAEMLIKAKAEIQKLEALPDTMIPTDLKKQIYELLESERQLSWDGALLRIAQRCPAFKKKITG
jgi:hypothetical protein